jgi:pimeloyl-ACP methyl ester carboxylesterase
MHADTDRIHQPTSIMANFLLIHGAWQGKWVWPAVAAELTMRGHEVHSIDLPGSGADDTPLEQVSLAMYAEAIARAVKAIGKRVTLVGHSMGGIAVTAAADRWPTSWRASSTCALSCRATAIRWPPCRS